MIGEQLGPYRIVREIGRGGMGAVYLAEHTELGQEVAIKVLLPSTEDDSVQRFFNEARAAAKVSHPGIVRIVDFGRAPDGAPYLAMELLTGETLRARLRAHGRLRFDEAATITRQVATTLAAAHAAGIVHRDLKPDNVMLVNDPETVTGERPKILDFGIAKLAEDQWTSSVSTRTGSLLGTPHYMSPEQCRGAGAIDARTDVYALGCILFELVCGRPPFVGEGMGEIVGKHQFVAPPTPSSLRADCPPWLEAVILRALAKDPGDRFASMEELAGALEAGGVPAARTGRGVEAASDAPVGLAETLRTPGDARVVTVAQVEHATGEDAAAIAQRRATELAQSLARDPKVVGTRGRGMTVIAVAVVVLASVALFVHFGKEPSEPRVRDVAAKHGGGRPVDTASGAPHHDVDEGQMGSGAASGSGGSGGLLPDVANVDTQYQHALDRARAAFASGDYLLARRLAGAAIAIRPDDDGYDLAVITSCHLKDATSARQYYQHVRAPDTRQLLAQTCADLGVELQP